jgi:hypothetical protein
MTRRNGKPRHWNRLVKSETDDIALCAAVEKRFLELCHLYKRTRETELPIPESLNNDFLHWRQMAVRHAGNDFRHTDAEIRSVRTIAQWTVDVKGILCNQEPFTLKWKD